MTKQVKKTERIDAHVSARKLVRDFRVISNRILYFASRGVLRYDFMREVSNILIDYSGCDSVELRLKAHDKCYRFEIESSTRKAPRFEIMNCVRNEDGGIIPCSGDDSSLECLCRDILSGKIDRSLPFFTKSGSYWTGDLENTLTIFSESGARHYDINQSKNYRSLAIIPLVEDDEKIGLMLLKSKEDNYFTEEEIDFYEDLAKTLVVATSYRMAQVGLRERVKELTCLYGISRLSEKTSTTLEEILQGIVELLPPAWLCPEIACARIIIDGNSYITENFQDGPQKQKVDIVVEGEHRGVVEMVYTVEKIELDEGPFLKEERKLIDTIAREIALKIEKRHAEDERIKLQEQLRHADRLATIGQLSAGVAHELNEPLSNILGFAQLIKKYPKLSEQTRKDVEKIVKASLHAREVIKKLMIFARQMPPQKTQVNLNRIVEEGLYFLESRCAKEGIKVVRSLSPDLPNITADLSQLTQVLVNLAVNAIQALEKGGSITITTRTSKDHILLIVEDTGCGMNEEVKKQIFLPFFTTKEIGQGTGLGLAVVHGIISSHGGTIEVESEVGCGSKFVVKLPVTVLENLEEAS